MINIWDTATLEKALHVHVPNGITTSTVQFNSVDISKGDLFIALKGSTDGHNYALDAINRGANAVIIDKEIDGIDPSKMIIVQDTWNVLISLAKFKRQNSKAQFIAVTGSAGKTSTKDAIYKVISQSGYKAFASRGTFNNHIGLPLNLASIPDDLEYGVFELGMNHSNEISPLSHLVKPHIALITNVLPVHLANFDNIQGIADAKCEIFDGMQENGTIVLNKDNAYYDYCVTKSPKTAKILGFGENEQSDSRLIKYEFDGHLAHLEFTAFGENIKCTTPLAGRHMAQNIAAVLAIAQNIGIPLSTSASVIANLSPLSGRGEIFDVNISGHSCKIIYDCYNANPSSIKSSLEHIKDIDHANKIVILGDMKELGTNEIEFHKALLEPIMNAQIKEIYTVGPLMSYLHTEIKNNCKSLHFADSNELKFALNNLITKDSLVLFKASKSVGLSSIVEELKKQI